MCIRDRQVILTPASYQIQYENLMEAANPNPTTYTSVTPDLCLLSPGPLQGYRFLGWYNAPAGGTQISCLAHGSTGNPSSEMTVAVQKLAASQNQSPFPLVSQSLFPMSHQNAKSTVFVSGTRTLAEGAIPTCQVRPCPASLLTFVFTLSGKEPIGSAASAHRL